MPRICTFTMESISPYSQSKYHRAPELPKESKDSYEERTWREKCTVDENDEIIIPPMAIKKAIETAAAFLRMKVPGAGSTLYTKYFLGGILVTEGPKVGIKKQDVEGEWFFLDARGKKGGGSRVARCFPVIRKYKVQVEAFILNDQIPNDIFEKTLIESGNFIGIGRFRPEKGGFYGRYRIVGKPAWTET